MPHPEPTMDPFMPFYDDLDVACKIRNPEEEIGRYSLSSSPNWNSLNCKAQRNLRDGVVKSSLCPIKCVFSHSLIPWVSSPLFWVLGIKKHVNHLMGKSDAYPLVSPQLSPGDGTLLRGTCKVSSEQVASWARYPRPHLLFTAKFCEISGVLEKPWYWAEQESAANTRPEQGKWTLWTDISSRLWEVDALLSSLLEYFCLR